MSTKILTDEQLETMGRNLATMHQLAITTWEIAMRTMPINSTQYRKICTAGRKTQDAYNGLRFEAESRGWDDRRIGKVFFSHVACGFS